MMHIHVAKVHAVAGEQNKQTTEEKTFTCKVRFTATR